MTREALHIGLREINGMRVLRLTGELDSFTSNRLAKISDPWVSGAKKFVVNLDDLQYIDSAGLSTLVWMWSQAKDRGAHMILSCRNPRIHRVLEITGLLNLFTVEASAGDPLLTVTTTTGYEQAVQPSAEINPGMTLRPRIDA